MNEKEIGEIRRRTRRDRSNMTAIYGCYVNTQKEIITEFRQSTGMMPENESEKYFGLLKRTLSGAIGKNLIDITFRTAQVAGSPEHKLLMDLRETGLKEESLRHQLYQKIIDNVSFDENYLILLGLDAYDVPFKSKDGETQADASSETYTYLQCAVCPVKLAKPIRNSTMAAQTILPVRRNWASSSRPLITGQPIFITPFSIPEVPKRFMKMWWMPCLRWSLPSLPQSRKPPLRHC